METGKTESKTKLVAFRIAPEMAEFIKRLAQENFRTQSQELRRIIATEKQRHERGEIAVGQ